MIPDFQTLMLPLLRLTEQGVETVPDCIPHVASQFALTPEELEEDLPSGRQRVITNRCHWARHYLYQAGLIEPIKRGHYRITDEGRKLLASNPQRISISSLEAYPAFLEFRARTRSKPRQGESASGAAMPEAAGDTSPEETPEQAIEQAFGEIETALTADLLAAMTAMEPKDFEQVIVDLLLAMGYGGGRRDMGVRLGKSGDGGIDGVINEDSLGLDAIYVQAKRYAEGQVVGRPALQAFVGSLTGEGATKGVFVTTADFTREARDYLNKVQHRIRLINGTELARLMIRHGVGVRVVRTYQIKTVDEGYFAAT